jgi:hypothetical protein
VCSSATATYTKGSSVFDPSEGRIYIFRDVVFDENVFPFARLHPNAGMRLRAELALLPDILKNPSAPSSSDFGNATVRDQTLVNSLPTNTVSRHAPAALSPGSGPVANEEGTTENGAKNSPHFLWPLASHEDMQGMRIGVDPPVPLGAEPGVPSTPNSASSSSAGDIGSPNSSGAVLSGAGSAPGPSTLAHPQPEAPTHGALHNLISINPSWITRPHNTQGGSCPGSRCRRCVCGHWCSCFIFNYPTSGYKASERYN